MKSMESLKACRTCRVPKPLEEFYKDPRLSDGRGNTCKKCSNLISARNKREASLRKRLEHAGAPILRLENNLLGLQILCEAFRQGKGQYITAQVQLEGAEFPIPEGIEIRKGNAGPHLIIQGRTRQFHKNLGIDMLYDIAKEMDLYGIEIVWKSLPGLNPEWPLTKALLARREALSQNDVIGGHNEKQIEGNLEASSKLGEDPEGGSGLV